LECDAFLTCDRKLARNSHHLNAELDILVLTPIKHWRILQPWAGLYV
jgi:hypothetical protein